MIESGKYVMSEAEMVRMYSTLIDSAKRLGLELRPNCKRIAICVKISDMSIQVFKEVDTLSEVELFLCGFESGMEFNSEKIVEDSK